MNQMDDLVAQLTKQAGLSEVVAKQVIQMVIDFIKSKLPEPIAKQLDGWIAGAGAGKMEAMGSIMKGIGDLFGGSKPASGDSK